MLALPVLWFAAPAMLIGVLPDVREHLRAPSSGRSRNGGDFTHMTSTQPRGSELPGVRALRSPRFRLLIAAVLAVYGIGMNAFLIDTLGSQGEWFEDYAAYIGATERMLDGLSPYTPAQLTEPIPAVCPGCYLYPPALAQAMTPLT